MLEQGQVEVGLQAEKSLSSVPPCMHLVEQWVGAVVEGMEEAEHKTSEASVPPGVHLAAVAVWRA